MNNAEYARKKAKKILVTIVAEREGDSLETHDGGFWTGRNIYERVDFKMCIDHIEEVFFMSEYDFESGSHKYFLAHHLWNGILKKVTQEDIDNYQYYYGMEDK